MIYDKNVGAAVDCGCQLLELPLALKGVCVGSFIWYIGWRKIAAEPWSQCTYITRHGWLSFRRYIASLPWQLSALLYDNVMNKRVL